MLRTGIKQKNKKKIKELEKKSVNIILLVLYNLFAYLNRDEYEKVK